jgi:hypothetical protein
MSRQIAPKTDASTILARGQLHGQSAGRALQKNHGTNRFIAADQTQHARLTPPAHISPFVGVRRNSVSCGICFTGNAFSRPMLFYLDHLRPLLSFFACNRTEYSAYFDAPRLCRDSSLFTHSQVEPHDDFHAPRGCSDFGTALGIAGTLATVPDVLPQSIDYAGDVWSVRESVRAPPGSHFPRTIKVSIALVLLRLGSMLA